MENNRKTLKTHIYDKIISICTFDRFERRPFNRHFTLRNDKLSTSPGLFIRNKYVPFENEYRTTPPFLSLDFYPDVNDPTRDVILVEIQIYSSDARKWKKLNRYFSESSCNAPFGNGVYWNGNVYWHPSDSNYLSYFDLHLEKLKELPIPSPEKPMGRYGYRSTYLYFGESRGHLHWVGTAKYGFRVYLLVYEMSRDHSWFVKYKVEIRDLPDVCPQMIRNNQFEVIDIVRGEDKEEDVFMVLKVKNKIIRYNILDKSCKHMTTVNNLIRIGRGEVHRYIQCLTSF